MQTLYTGAAGQASVMSEFLIRGYNVAVPEVDRGDDLFVVEDESGGYYRIQVKTATASPLKTPGGYTAQFNIPFLQLESPQTPELYYILAVRFRDTWKEFVVLERTVLYREHEVHHVGTLVGKKKKSVKLYLSFRDDALKCSKRDWQHFRGDFSHWPRIQH
jgi:hypothetical protein